MHRTGRSRCPLQTLECISHPNRHAYITCKRRLISQSSLCGKQSNCGLHLLSKSGWVRAAGRNCDKRAMSPQRRDAFWEYLGLPRWQRKLQVNLAHTGRTTAARKFKQVRPSLYTHHLAHPRAERPGSVNICFQHPHQTASAPPSSEYSLSLSWSIYSFLNLSEGMLVHLLNPDPLNCCFPSCPYREWTLQCRLWGP